MRRLLFYSALVLNAHALVAQAPTDSTTRLTYYFVRPSQTALAHAMAGLPTLDGEFVAVYDPKLIIPTLSQWGLIILAVLLFAAIVLMRNRFQAFTAK